MNKIIKLDAKVANMIAAGEVVERPSGIVKELIENSIDAQATRIVVSIREGGILYIKVEDNGIGMSREDAQLCFERHATSKIKHESQLFEIQTLGFRGEALPSIAAVSEVILTTNNHVEATKVVVEHGILKTVSASSRNLGTTIEVSNLFQNTPARLKHLSNNYYEASKVAEVIKKFACSYPNVSFCLISEGKTIFETSGNGNIQEIMAKLYDYTILKDMIIEKVSNEDFTLHLILAQPQFTRNKNSILIYINNRLVKSYKIQKAIIEAYKNFIPVDRMPIAVINIEMDYRLVDVNVHPSKQEVRISKENYLLVFISETIEKLLNKKYEVPKPINKPLYETMALSLDYREQYVEEIAHDLFVEEDVVEEHKEVEHEVSVKPQNIFHTLRVISQLQGKYILCEHENGLYVIDQHAAAERINYEKIQQQLLSNTVAQVTLLPITVPLSVDEQLRMNDIIITLKSINVVVDQLSENSLVLREIPDWIRQENIMNFIKDIIQKIMLEENISLEMLRKHAIATAACHSSIRFNRHLNIEEMKSLVENLANCDHPYHCPHGRTVVICIDNTYLEKQFMRV